MEKDFSKWPDVIVGRPGGYCMGVARAVKAYESFQPQYSVGEPAHNPVLIEKFKKQGMVFVHNVSEIPDGATVAFGPHGHTEEDVTKANEKGTTFLLTECPYVTSVKAEIAANTESGITTIYFGTKDGKGAIHPEARAALSAGNAILVTSLEEALAVKVTDPEKVGFACQTTHNADKALEIADKLREKYPKLKMRPRTDLCPATKNRQMAAKSVNADITIIVGDWFTSSNTRSLAEKALEKGRVFVVNTREELRPEDFQSVQIVGIIGSASAMQEQIEGVIEFFTERGSVRGEVVITEEKQNLPEPEIYKPS